jgi:hypothetical protein
MSPHARTARRGPISPKSFENGLRALLVLNLADALFTLAWVQSGLASEANPVMAGAIDLGPAIFILSKIGLVSLAVLLLWRNRTRLSARLALVPLAMLYAFVAGGHVGFAILQGLLAAPQVFALG